MFELKLIEWKIAEIVTQIIDSESAFGMVIGDIEWQAGCSTGDSAFAKGKTNLSIDEIISTLDGILQYIRSKGKEWTI